MCPFQGKQLTLSMSLADSLRPRESRILEGSVRARGMGGWSLPQDSPACGGPQPLATAWVWLHAWDRLGVCGRGFAALILCLSPLPSPAGVRTEQDLYVRLIDSVTKQVSPVVHHVLFWDATPHLSLTSPLLP